MTEDNYILIFNWMRTKLGLKGTELFVYAIIYSFSQDGESEYRGGIRYLSEATGASKNTISRALQSLTEKDLIKKDDIYIAYNVKLCNYSANLGAVSKCDRASPKWGGGIPKMGRGHPQNGEGASPKLGTYNIINNTKDNTIDKNIYGEFENVRLTDEEYEKVKANGWTSLIEELSSYKASKGKQYKNDFATLTNWAKRKGKEKGQLKTRPSFDIDEISRRAKYNDEYDI